VLILAVTSLAGVSAMAALIATRSQFRGVAQNNDATRAEALAESAVEWALSKIAADANWRTTYTSGVETTPVALGGGTVAFKLVDEADGNLANVVTDSVRLYGIGRFGAATRVYSVQASGRDALSCLNVPLCVGGTLKMGKTIVDAAGATIACNADVDGDGNAVVNASVEACDSVNGSGWSLSGTQTSGVPARSMPAASAFDYYLANGTVINYSSISGGDIKNVVISPTQNPYSLLNSVTNPKGIYIIDCGGQKLTITNCRIVGTLVVLNPGGGSRLGDSTNGGAICWAPAVPNYPCLLVKGDIKLSFSANKTTVLSETLLLNYNPPGTPYPYPGGAEDILYSDNYPSRIAGLVYISGDADGDKYVPAVDMLVIGGKYETKDDNLVLSYNPLFSSRPPPGFAGAGPLMPMVGSWRWEKNQ
jgi:hypothetical protein